MRLPEKEQRQQISNIISTFSGTFWMFQEPLGNSLILAMLSVQFLPYLRWGALRTTFSREGQLLLDGLNKNLLILSTMYL